ncbi:Retrovirus-related Pol polyprotein from transposon TNT 1-94 [Apostasia shenzhenica]|uniref:Retrovirus-related Pol polyprotein from transposon TNT 1-94 n=1 Tax=Apostasia shenzhenica TaxID=1088818 RepID=A0A2I0B6L3_9ASPA|nr:Retrovirus-related Pol polyprotein from transposon TNT 1-94 [Apostasia shenzhenica]PKA63422.1 Retrovirus-related Pol polyprotein from transposon TNT 1-94 [Apostasia shenzhenica]
MNDAKALSRIQNGVTATIFPRIIRAKTAKEAWDILKGEFEGDEKLQAVKLHSLKRQFENLKMRDGETMTEYFSRIIELVNQMKGTGEDIKDQRVVEKILVSLPPAYDDIVAIIEESKDLSTLSIQKLMSSLHLHEERKWQVDSACSNHMTSHEELFETLDTSVKTRVQIGDGSFLEAKGCGDIVVETENGKQLMCNVLLVPSLSANLLSVGQLLEHGYKLNFHINSCEIFDKSNSFIANVRMTSKRSFPLELKCSSANAFQVESETVTGLWHRRFGHLNVLGLKMLKDKNLVEGLPEIEVEQRICEPCVFGKHARNPFPQQGSWKAKQPLQLIHTDLCGKMSTESLGNCFYFLTFIDDYSRYTWVYFLKSKSESFKYFKEFKALVEKMSGFKIQNLRSDRGGEFNSFEFNEYCKIEGINRQLTAPYTPQQNGTAERKNRTLVEMATAMMEEKGLPKIFWAEAISTAVYLQNRCPTKALKDITPFEAWNSFKPSVSHLKIFGSICFVQVPTEKRIKFDRRSTKCIFLGYDARTKGYRAYDVENKSLIVSRDVIFDENSAWNWKQTNYEEAKDQKEWQDAMKEEIHMIQKNKTWTLVPRPPGKQIIGVKWVYKIKYNSDGTVQKNKARLVAKGFSQKAGEDYSETFAPVARMETIRILFAVAAMRRWIIHHLDVKSAFLNGMLEEDVYCNQPPGFEVDGEEDKVLKLHKALYGLKQAPRAWNAEIDRFFLQNGFQKSCNEATLYTLNQNGHILIISIYVDDLLVTGDDEGLIQNFKDQMKSKYEMSDMGQLRYFLGLEVHQSSKGIFISQKNYIQNVLKRFRMNECKAIDTPLSTSDKLKKEDGAPEANSEIYRSLIGSLLYVTISRPDLMFAASLLSRYMHQPSKKHFSTAKRVLRYLKGTIDHGLFYRSEGDCQLWGFCDSDWAGCVDDSKSTSGYIFFLNGAICSWMSKKQSVVAQSSAEAEYIAMAKATSQLMWLKRILADLGVKVDEKTVIYCDNTSAMAIAKNPVFHDRTKHIQIKFHFIRDAVKEGLVEFKFCSTENQLADILTKPLTKNKFINQKKEIGIQPKYCVKGEC